MVTLLLLCKVAENVSRLDPVGLHRLIRGILVVVLIQCLSCCQTDVIPTMHLVCPFGSQTQRQTEAQPKVNTTLASPVETHQCVSVPPLNLNSICLY